MESRDRLLAAAARVYAEAGFRGATTRRIADEAGVNEITIFRLFGSKATLIDEAIRARAGTPPAVRVTLPEVPSDPERELTAWAAAHMAYLRTSRSLIRNVMSDLKERPEVGPCTAEPTLGAAQDLKRYMIRMADAGLVDFGNCRPAGRNELAHAAGAMLMGALFADVMGRDVVPELYPQPVDRAPALYVRLFLCAIGMRPPMTPAAGEGRKSVRKNTTLLPKNTR